MTERTPFPEIDTTDGTGYFALIIGAYAQDLQAEDEARERLRAEGGAA